MTLDIITELFCKVDDFCKRFVPLWTRKLLAARAMVRQRARSLIISEIMTIVILFHRARYRDFKHFYFSMLYHWKKEFPGLPSYQRFVEWMPSALIPLGAYLKSRLGRCTGISFVDATALAVCHNRRIYRHKVFAGLAQRGKTSMGWFYGFKLHLTANDVGELLGFRLTAGNTDDREVLIPLVKGLFGKLFGDKGYISAKKAEALLQQGLQLITGLKARMKNRLMPLLDKLLLRKRAIMETINDQLKNISQIEHTRHRSPTNFVVNLLSGLIAYTHQDKKPSIYRDELLPLLGAA